MIPSRVAAVVTLLLGTALAAIVVTYGAALVERAVPLDTTAPLADTLFNVAIFGTLLGMAIIGGIVSGVSTIGLGRPKATMLAFGTIAGLLGIVVATGYSGLAGTLIVGERHAAQPGLLVWGLLVILLQAGAEEVYFRGWLQPVMARAWGVAPAIVLSAAAFAALHIAGGARTPLTLVNLFLGGLLFGILAAYGRGLTGAVAAHVAWNAAEQLLLGLDPNPGIGSFGSVFDFDLVGASAWGGSAEGLNASFAMASTLFALLIPMALLLRRALAVRD